MEAKIREFILSLGVDDVGFAAAGEYNNPKSYQITEILPKAKSVVVMAFKVLSNCESPALSPALNGYKDLEAFARNASYRAARFLESHYKAKVVTIPNAGPIEIRKDRPAIADFSHRHAAVAAGLGTFGRHNLVIHPEFGTRVNFASIITDIALEPTPKIDRDLCIHCDLCVKNCPGNALEEPGCTNVPRCAKNSLPYGIASNIGFWSELLAAPEETRAAMLRSEDYARLQQAANLGNLYMCFNCMKSCPVGLK